MGRFITFIASTGIAQLLAGGHPVQAQEARGQLTAAIVNAAGFQAGRTFQNVETEP